MKLLGAPLLIPAAPWDVHRTEGPLKTGPGKQMEELCLGEGGIWLTSACMSYIVLRWSQMTLDGTCRPMFWLNLSRIQIMWKCRFTPVGEKSL